MGWLDPVECKAARDYLAKGRPKEAAEVLLKAKQQDHRAVRQLLVEVGQQLVVEAQKEAEQNLLEAAQATLQLAAQCICLDGPALLLQAEIEKALEEQRQLREAQQRKQAKAAERIAEARQLAERGEFTSAFQVVALLQRDGTPEAQALAEEIRLYQERFQRAVEKCRQAINTADSALARHYWNTVRQLCPHSPEVKKLAAELARVVATRTGLPSQPVPVTSRTQRFVIGNVGAVILAQEVGIGSPRGENVQLPILGRIHQRHAVLVWDRQGWQIMTCCDKYGKDCPVTVDRVPVDRIARLTDNQVVQLGHKECSWRFRQPVPGSFTAVWEQLPDSRATIYCSHALSIKRVFLLVDYLIVGSQPPAHLLVPELPCQQVTLRWQGGGLHWEVEGGTFRLEVPGLSWDSEDRQVYVPSRLVIEGTWNEAERLGRMLLAQEDTEQTFLDFLPWGE